MIGLRPVEAGKSLYRIARIVQEKSRELAVLESMKESGFGREGGLQGLAAYCKLV